MAAVERIRVKQTSSSIGQTQRQRQTLLGLGLGRVGKSVDLPGEPRVLGMIRKVAHLVKVEGQ